MSNRPASETPKTDIPEGYQPYARVSPFTRPWFPLYARKEDAQYRLATRLRDVHCNGRGLIHGGFIAAIADNAMGLSLGRVLAKQGREVSGIITLNLSTDYLGMAKIGQWFETDSRVLKTGRSVSFVECYLLADGERIARASATFKHR